MVNRLRLLSGLVLMIFLVMHLGNHTLGLISLEAMEAGLPWTVGLWRTALGTVLLLTALIIHASLAFWSLYNRYTLRLRPRELVQMVLGLLVPLLIITHVAATRMLTERFGLDGGYEYVLAALWLKAPQEGILQAMVLVVAWVHGCMGLHAWLRLKSWYQNWQWLAYSLVLLLPTLALAGYLAAGMRVLALDNPQGWADGIFVGSAFEPFMAGAISETTYVFRWMVLGLIVAILLARWGRSAVRSRLRAARLHHKPLDRCLVMSRGATVLETLRAAGIPHASVCGGKGRCSTCRVRIEAGGDALPLPSTGEQAVLDRIGAPPTVRLACQIRPTQDLAVAPLLPADATVRDAFFREGLHLGQERDVAILFIDLRDSTRLSESRLPFDFVFVLNQFLAEMEKALKETDGHYAQFNGDGLMALYGLDTGLAQGCRQALAGARAMTQRLAELNKRLGTELPEPLRAGIGIHSGHAIVGSMGPPASPIVSALGDNVNLAARLEAQSKELGVTLVVSVETLQHAGIEIPGASYHSLALRGLARPVDVVAIEDPESLLLVSGVP